MPDWFWANYWLIGVVGAIVFFAIGEYKACQHPEKLPTLSMTIHRLAAKFPITMWVMGFFAGGLTVHLFWHWCPPGSTSFGLLIQ